jgi:hypothetical protein
MNEKSATLAIEKFIVINRLLTDLLVQAVELDKDDKAIIFYKRAIGNIMGESFEHLLRPIFRIYPHLIPKELLDLGFCLD